MAYALGVVLGVVPRRLGVRAVLPTGTFRGRRRSFSLSIGLYSYAYWTSGQRGGARRCPWPEEAV
jgi:hypothetical protein